MNRAIHWFEVPTLAFWRTCTFLHALYAHDLPVYPLVKAVMRFFTGRTDSAEILISLHSNG
jgi:hypothetical protein